MWSWALYMRQIRRRTAFQHSPADPLSNTPHGLRITDASSLAQSSLDSILKAASSRSYSLDEDGICGVAHARG